MNAAYRAAEAYLLSLANLRAAKNPKRRRAGTLRRMRRLCDLLGNPESQLPHVIHVTGTSGKGSTATYLATMLRVAGYHTGLMISPHPTTLLERWTIDGKPMSKREFVHLVARLKPALDRYEEVYSGDPLSFFELMTAIGFLFFAMKRVSWAVIEVGVGGRQDATNILPKKDYVVITTIGRDHEDVLGDLPDIAREKAGIITPGALVFLGDIPKNLLPLIKREIQKKRASLTMPSRQHEAFATVGTHQQKNAALAAAVASAIGLKKRDIQKGLARAIQPLRMERVSQHPLIILDGAHNPDKIKTAVATMHDIRRGEKYEHVHLLVGFSADKQWRHMAKQLASLSPASVICTRNTANPFRAVAPPGLIATSMKKLLPHATVSVRLDPYDALRAARKRLKKHDILLITGSIFLSGQLRSAIDKNILMR